MAARRSKARKKERRRRHAGARKLALEATIAAVQNRTMTPGRRH